MNLTALFKAFETAQVLATELPKAMADGKITAMEALTIMAKLGAVWGFTLAIDVPPLELSAMTAQVLEENPDAINPTRPRTVPISE